MIRVSTKILLKSLSTAICSGVALCAALPAISQTPVLQPRITAPIDNTRRATLHGSRPPRANPANDVGAVPPSMKLQGISLVFSRSAAQQTALDNLVAAQQNPASPLYHHWLTPEEFAAQFGVADADVAAAETWLEQQGFSVDSVAHSRNRITFSGTAAQVASAFGAPLHYYRKPAVGTQPAVTHFAPSADLTLPSALASSVVSINNLSSFRPHPHVKIHAASAQATPRFTSSQTGANFLTPADVDTIYGVSGATGAGYIGTGQTIIIIGQSAIETSDLTNFQSALGIPNKLPNLILMPNTGASEVNPVTDEDEVESDLDLEYSQAIARGATIDFIYTGSNTNYGAFDALVYAIENKSTYPASIISSSYGDCETDLGQSNYNILNGYLEQASSEGITVIAAAGDDGSTDCNGEVTNKSEEEALAVDFPADSQYVTAMGGTEFLLPDVAPGSSYFDTQSSADIISSARSYIPEQVWNDDAGNVSLGSTSPSPISSGGGGVSAYTPRPTWQTGTIGGVAIPSGSYRMVPDISLYASPGEPDVAAGSYYGGLLYCSSDTAATHVTGSCSHGFRDTSNNYLTVAGGTSFDAPIFSGMLAIINQARGFTSTNGQGVINSTLYTLAANATTYGSAFHDVTVGGNQCLGGSTYCGTGPQTSGYAAATGYDEGSGLGSIDLYNLLTSWPTGTPTGGTGSNSFTLAAANVTVAPGASGTGTITITPANGYTGTVNLTVSDANLTDGCIIFNPTSVVVTGTAAVTARYTVYAGTSACTAARAVIRGQKIVSHNHGTAPHLPKSPWKQLPISAMFAGTFLLACFRRRSRLLRASMTLGLLLLLSISGLGLTGCGGSSSTSTNSPSSPSSTNTPAGPYTLTLIGTDSVTSTITNSTTFTVTVN